MNNKKIDSSNSQNVDAEYRLDLLEILQVLYKKKIMIIMTALGFFCAAVSYSLTLSNHYQTETILMVKDQSNRAMSGGIGGLASMAGLTLGNGSSTKIDLAEHTIKSRFFLKHLLDTDSTLLPKLMASKNFNSKTKKIIFDNKLYDSQADKWLRKATPSRNSKPSYLEVHKRYLSMLTIVVDQMTGYISIKFEHVSPVFASDFLELIINEVNELLRKKDLKESADALNYLTTEVPKSSIISMREAMNELIEGQLETQMMAKIDGNYVLKTIEPPYIPEEKSKPIRSILALAGLLLGFVISSLYVLIRTYIFKRKV